MRIIAGRFRGRRLVAPKGMSTRPTTDRTRESLFNILSNLVDFEGLRVLDLFAGTGALGLESISRGAAHALFVDSDSPACAAIRINIEALRIAEKAHILKEDATRLGPPSNKQRYDVVFADPPYGMGFGERVAERLVKSAWLKRNGLFVLEEHASQFPQTVNAFDLIDKRQFRDTTIGMFQLKS